MFWNICAQQSDFSPALRDGARAHRVREAEHRQCLKEARRALARANWEVCGRPELLRRSHLVERLGESAALTADVQNFCRDLDGACVPRGIGMLRARSSWLDDVLREALRS